MSSVLPEFITILQAYDPKTTWVELTQRQLYLPESVIMERWERQQDRQDRQDRRERRERREQRTARP